MAVKFDLPRSRYNKIAIWINCLALILLLILAYVFFFKRYDMHKKAELNDQRLIVSTVKKNIDNERYDPLNTPEIPGHAAMRPAEDDEVDEIPSSSAKHLTDDEVDEIPSSSAKHPADDEVGEISGRPATHIVVDDEVGEIPGRSAKHPAEDDVSVYSAIEPNNNQEAILSTKIIDDGKPIIALVIGELGMSKSNLELELPTEITFGFSSYIDISNAYPNNQLLLNIPLQSVDYPNDDAGPQALLLKNSEQENLNRLNYVLDKKINHQGVYTSADENYTNSEKDAEFLLFNLKQRNLIYLCGILDKNNLIYQLAKKIDFHILANDVILDDIISSEAINDKLIELENIAREQGNAIAIGSSYPLTIELLKKWIPSLKEKDIKILPIKDYYKITEIRRASSLQVEPNDIR